MKKKVLHKVIFFGSDQARVPKQSYEIEISEPTISMAFEILARLRNNGLSLDPIAIQFSQTISTTIVWGKKKIELTSKPVMSGIHYLIGLVFRVDAFKDGNVKESSLKQTTKHIYQNNRRKVKNGSVVFVPFYGEAGKVESRYSSWFVIHEQDSKIPENEIPVEFKYCHIKRVAI